MNKKNDTMVTINGKKYNIAGYENVEYLHRIADYINAKQLEIKESVGNNIVNDSEKNILSLINIADDYLKLQDGIEGVTIEADEGAQSKEELRSSVIALKKRLLAVENENRLLKDENTELKKKLTLAENELRRK